MSIILSYLVNLSLFDGIKIFFCYHRTTSQFFNYKIVWETHFSKINMYNTVPLTITRWKGYPTHLPQVYQPQHACLLTKHTQCVCVSDPIMYPNIYLLITLCLFSEIIPHPFSIFIKCIPSRLYLINITVMFILKCKCIVSKFVGGK